MGQGDAVGVDRAAARLYVAGGHFELVSVLFSPARAVGTALRDRRLLLARLVGFISLEKDWDFRSVGELQRAPKAAKSKGKQLSMFVSRWQCGITVGVCLRRALALSSGSTRFHSIRCDKLPSRISRIDASRSLGAFPSTPPRRRAARPLGAPNSGAARAIGRQAKTKAAAPRRFNLGAAS